MDLLSAVSVFLGAITSFLLLSMRVFPQRWARMFADAARGTGRPKWSWAGIAGSIIGIGVVWYLHFFAGSEYSLLIAILSTFLLGRTLQTLIFKKDLRQGIQTFLQGSAAVAFIPYTITGIVLIILGLL